MVTTALDRARSGDGEAFRELTDPYRRELQVHCYRILGSVQDAEDILQETLLAAWRGLARFEERASIRSWLYKIATNRCLNALRDTGRRPRSAGGPAVGLDAPEPTRRTEPLWLQPYPDALLDDLPDAEPGPEARAVRIVPTRANGQPAFAYYVADAPIAHGLAVLTLAGDKISAITRFGASGLLPHFGLPETTS